MEPAHRELDQSDGVKRRILEPENRRRYLRLIAIFKIAKGSLLFLLGVSILFLGSRAAVLDAASDWVSDEILLEHSRAISYLLNKLQAVLTGDALRASGLLALLYATVLFVEGIGVYLQKRWAEYLMVFATAALIPVEVRHILHRPSLLAFIILGVNCFIVWFLYIVLRRAPAQPSPPKREVAMSSP